MKTMRITVIFLAAAFWLGLVFVPSVLAQGLSQSDFTLKTRGMDKDNLGTKIKNIKVFEVGVAPSKGRVEERYTVKLYLDGRYYHKYDNAPMPFEFKQNFKGISAGPHTFKIEIIDAGGNVISTQESYIDVSR